jgi:hypothetical protein
MMEARGRDSIVTEAEFVTPVKNLSFSTPRSQLIANKDKSALKSASS